MQHASGLEKVALTSQNVHLDSNGLLQKLYNVHRNLEDVLQMSRNVRPDSADVSPTLGNMRPGTQVRDDQGKSKLLLITSTQFTERERSHQVIQVLVYLLKPIES